MIQLPHRPTLSKILSAVSRPYWSSSESLEMSLNRELYWEARGERRFGCGRDRKLRFIGTQREGGFAEQKFRSP